MSFNKIAFFLLTSFVILGCTETYPLLTNTYEEAIVVEATLTNELKNQEIKITKTSRFEVKTIAIEKEALVIVKVDDGNEYLFDEISGVYKSRIAFQIVPTKSYTLFITTKNGNTYQSTPEKLTTVSPIQSITPVISSNKDNEKGVEIKVNSNDPSRKSQYYRYEYEETYKIIAPKWSSLKLVVTGPESVNLVPNNPNTKVCYTTKNSTDIILVNTNDQLEDRVSYPIRFFIKDDYRIADRYSIKVTQYVESLSAYTFHKTMRDISSSESILSPKQPGVIAGNIKCTNNPDLNAIGYFDVASVSSKRIFFNFDDVFPLQSGKAYLDPCEERLYSFTFKGLDPQGENMIYALEQNQMTYVKNLGLTYTLVPAVCGDCTTFSSNIKPSFWID